MQLNITLSESESRELMTAVIKKCAETTSQQITTQFISNKEEFDTLFSKALGKSIRSILRDQFEGRLFRLSEELFPENLIEMLNRKQAD